jgi:ankyrin repeat protein
MEKKTKDKDLNIDVHLKGPASHHSSQESLKKNVTETIKKITNLDKIQNNNLSNESNVALFMFASEKGNVKVIKKVVEEGGIDVNVKDLNGISSLMIACQNGHEEAVHYLCECGVDIEAKSNNHWNAMMFACDNGHLAIAQYLFERGASLNEKNLDGWNALMLASDSGHLDIVQFLVQNKIEINEKSLKGNNALMFASDNGHTAIVKFLIDSGININEKKR